MEPKDWIYLAGLVATLLVALIVNLVSVVSAHNKQSNRIDLVNQDLQNHKENHLKLEERVEEHEQKIDGKLDAMNLKIDSNHKEISKSLTEIQVAIEGLKK